MTFILEEKIAIVNDFIWPVSERDYALNDVRSYKIMQRV